MTRLLAANAAGLSSRRQKTTMATLWGVWDPPFWLDLAVAHATSLSGSTGATNQLQTNSRKHSND